MNFGHQTSAFGSKAYRTVLVTWSTSKLFYRVASKTSYDRLGSNLSFSNRRHSPQLSFGKAIVKTWNGVYIPFFDLKILSDINSIHISKLIRFLISTRCWAILYVTFSKFRNGLIISPELAKRNIPNAEPLSNVPITQFPQLQYWPFNKVVFAIWIDYTRISLSLMGSE